MAQVTDQSTYNRRKFIAGALGLTALGTFATLRYRGRMSARAAQALTDESSIVESVPSAENYALTSSNGGRLTTKYAATHYNNAYEFGWNKSDPSERSGNFNMRPWSVTIDGLCHRPGTFDVDDLMGMPFNQLEERVYDFRCVEAWSMVIPYNGRPLRDILAAVEPMGSAHYVAFTSAPQRCLDKHPPLAPLNGHM